MTEAIAPAPSQVQAAVRARDGWLFVGLAHLGLLGLVPLAVGLTTFAIDDPFSVLSVVGFSAWVVLGLVGGARLYQAHRAGHVLVRNRIGLWAWWIASRLVLLALATAAVVKFVAPRWEWATPIALTVFFAYTRFRGTNPRTVAQWQVVLSCAAMIFGLSASFWLSTLSKPKPLFGILAVGLMGLVWMYAGFRGLIQLHRLRQPAWFAWVLAYGAFVLTLALRLLTTQQSFSGRMAVSVIPLPVLAGAAVWWLLSRRSVWLRVATTTVALAVGLVAATVTVMVSMILGVATSLDHFHPDREYAWHLPELVRTPLTRTAGLCSPRLKEICAGLGLSSTDDIKAQLHASDEHIVRWIWTTLRLRDPDYVYQTALAVPVNPLPGLDGVLRYDYMAGVEIGFRGSLNDIRQRLQQPYSNNLKAGVVAALQKRTKADRDALVDDILQQWLALPVNAGRWQSLDWVYAQFMQEFPERAMPVIETTLTAAPMKRNSRISSFGLIIPRLPDPEPLLLRMFNANNVDARKAAFPHTKLISPPEKLLPVMAQIAGGTLPSSDPEEQRLAGDWLAKTLKIPTALRNAGNSPLTTAETLWLKMVVGVANAVEATRKQ